MINTKKRSVLAVLGLAIGMAIVFAVSPVLAETGQNEQAGLPMAKAGPLEITPTLVKLVLTSDGYHTYFIPVFRFKIKNTSASDVRIILFKNSLEAFDDLDSPWYKRPQDGLSLTGVGVALSDQKPGEFETSFTKEKDKFVTLPPQQTVEARIFKDPFTTKGAHLSFDDPNKQLLETHRPKTITSLKASIGIVELDNKIQVVPFSFSDLPITEITVE